MNVSLLNVVSGLLNVWTALRAASLDFVRSSAWTECTRLAAIYLPSGKGTRMRPDRSAAASMWASRSSSLRAKQDLRLRLHPVPEPRAEELGCVQVHLAPQEAG